MLRLIFQSIAAASLLAGCASSSPPLTADHPASPDAAEGSRLRSQSSLRADALTKKSRALISSAAHEQEESDKQGAEAGTSAEKAPAAAHETMPGMNHEQMKGMNQ